MLINNYCIIFLVRSDVVLADNTVVDDEISYNIFLTNNMLATIAARYFVSRHKGIAETSSNNTNMLIVSMPQNYCTACSASTPFMHGRCNVCSIHCQLRFICVVQSVTPSFIVIVLRSLCTCGVRVLLTKCRIHC